MRVYKNKKALIGDTMAWAGAFLIIFFLMLVLVSVSAYLGKDKKASYVSIGENSQDLVLVKDISSFMNAPIFVSEGAGFEAKISVYELIGDTKNALGDKWKESIVLGTLDYTNTDIKDKASLFKSKAKEIFSLLLPENKWQLNIFTTINAELKNNFKSAIGLDTSSFFTEGKMGACGSNKFIYGEMIFPENLNAFLCINQETP